MAIHFAEPKATFIHIPKTGGTSFEHWCYYNINYDSQDRHCTIKDAEKLWKNLGITFTFVRNPFDRMVSTFHFLGQRAQLRIKMRKLGKPTKKNTNQHDDLLISEYYMKGFENWLVEQANNTKNPFDLGVNGYERKTPMIYWIDNKIDIVIKIEELKNKIYKLEDLFNCKIDLPVTNTSQRRDYKFYYNDNTKKIVENFFKADLEKFNYKF